MGLQLNRLDDAVEEGLGGIMSMYTDGAESKVDAPITVMITYKHATKTDTPL